MTTIEIISGALLILCSIAVILSVLFQSGKSGMSGAIMGTAGETVRGRSRALDEKLARITRILAVAFFVLAILVDIIALIVGAE